jgi:hypothetical protein
MEAHDHPELGIKAVIGFRFADLLDSWSGLVLGEKSEAEMLAQRLIPRNVSEGCERERRKALRDSPALDLSIKARPTP